MSKAEKLVGWGGWEDVRKKEMGERSLGEKRARAGQISREKEREREKKDGPGSYKLAKAELGSKRADLSVPSGGTGPGVREGGKGEAKWGMGMGIGDGLEDGRRWRRACELRA